MKFIKGAILIETKFSDESKDNVAKTICDWADKHEMYTKLGWNEKGDYLCEYEKKGRTQAFCKGCAAELKDLIKTSFNAKVKTIFEAY
jgi:hypothetical protein